MKIHQRARSYWVIKQFRNEGTCYEILKTKKQAGKQIEAKFINDMIQLKFLNNNTI